MSLIQALFNAAARRDYLDRKARRAARDEKRGRCPDCHKKKRYDCRCRGAL